MLKRINAILLFYVKNQQNLQKWLSLSELHLIRTKEGGIILSLYTLAHWVFYLHKASTQPEYYRLLELLSL